MIPTVLLLTFKHYADYTNLLLEKRTCLALKGKLPPRTSGLMPQFNGGMHDGGRGRGRSSSSSSPAAAAAGLAALTVMAAFAPR